MSKSGTLALWSVPDGKAIYVAERVGQGVAGLSPGRKYVVVFRDNALRFLDASTGDTTGTSQPMGGSGTAGLQAVAFRDDGREIAVVVNESIVRIDLTSGKVVEEFVSPIPTATVLQYAGPKFVLVDNRQLFELETKRVVWNFVGGIHASQSPDGIHWATARAIGQMGLLSGFELPSPELVSALATEASPKTKVLLKQGISVAIDIEGTPPRDPQGFRSKVVSGLSEQLVKQGMKVGPGGPAKLVVGIQERETGRQIQMTAFGGGGKAPENRTLPDRELTVRLTLNDGAGTPIVLYEQKSGSRVGLQGLPPGETDWDGYLRQTQWLAGVKPLYDNPLPFYVGRASTSVALLPWVDGSGESDAVT